MGRKLVSVLVAVIEDSNGDTREEQIARVDGEHSFTKEEKEQALNKLYRFLGKGQIVCETYEDMLKVWY